LNKRLQDYVTDETAANIPLMVFHNVITRDGKKLLISTQPLRFMMQPSADSNELSNQDAVDFTTFFAKQNPFNLRLLTTLRMNATFPVVLPNVWLPSEPVIDVMDGGLRDNYGVETALRFLSAMHSWIEQNTRGVLIVQIRDRVDGGWENPYETSTVTENVVKPFFLLQHNWYKMMEYGQSDMTSYFLGKHNFPVQKINFQYTPYKEENKATLNFHLTQREKLDVSASLDGKGNKESLEKVKALLNTVDKKDTSILSQQ